jgi:hypothetical protein
MQSTVITKSKCHIGLELEGFTGPPYDRIFKKFEAYAVTFANKKKEYINISDQLGSKNGYYDSSTTDLHRNIPLFNEQSFFDKNFDQEFEQLAKDIQQNTSEEFQFQYMTKLLHSEEFKKISKVGYEILRFCCVMHTLVIVRAVTMSPLPIGNIVLDRLAILLCETLLRSYSMMLNEAESWFTGWIGVFIRLFLQLEILYKRNKGYEMSLITVYHLLLRTIQYNEKLPPESKSTYPTFPTTKQQRIKQLSFQQIIQDRLNKSLASFEKQQTQQAEQKKTSKHLHEQLMKYSGFFQKNVRKDSLLKHCRYGAILKSIIDQLKEKNNDVLPQLTLEEFKKLFVDTSYCFPIIQQSPITVSLLKIPGKSKLIVLYEYYQKNQQKVIP